MSHRSSFKSHKRKAKQMPLSESAQSLCKLLKARNPSHGKLQDDMMQDCCKKKERVTSRFDPESTATATQCYMHKL